MNIKLLTGNIDYSIAMFIDKDFEVLSQFPYSIISSIDSNRNPIDLITDKEIAKTISNFKDISKQLSILTKDLKKLLQEFDLFNGFDEIWFFSEIPKNPIPQAFWITGPREIQTDFPTGLLEWMEINHCGLGLGDGIGMNYVTIYSNISEYMNK